MSNDSNSRDEYDAMAEVTRRPVCAPAERVEHTALHKAAAAGREAERAAAAENANAAEVDRLRAALRTIAARDTGHVGLDGADPWPYDGMDASDGYAAGLADADRACAEIARAALTLAVGGAP
jgi:hypothetical protein